MAMSGDRFGEIKGKSGKRRVGRGGRNEIEGRDGERAGVRTGVGDGGRNGARAGARDGEKMGVRAGVRDGARNEGRAGARDGEKMGIRVGVRDEERVGAKDGMRAGARAGAKEGARTGAVVKAGAMGDGSGSGRRQSDKGSRNARNGGSVRGNERKFAGKNGAEQKPGRLPREAGAVTRQGKKSLCPVFKQCGGCQLLDMEYEKQLEWKQKYLEEQLKGLCPVKGVIGMKDPFHYRNKVHAVFDRDRRGNIISGIYQENTHIVVPVERCLIEDEKADEIIGTIRGMLKSFKIRTYDEDTGFGLLRHVLVRRGFATGEIMVVLVTASPVFPSKNNFVKALREKHPEITTIVQNVNGRGTSMVLGDKEHVLYGKGYIEDVLCGLRFCISSKSFYQVNPAQTEILYNKALELAGLTGKETVLDAYCGIGTIGLIASKQAGKVIGVELNPDAVKDAVNNAKRNGITNAKFYCNDAGKFLVNMAAKGEKVDLVIMDPPRSGSTEEFLRSVAEMKVEKVVYVSCNPETLARDLKVMRKLGYKAEMGWGVDMFGGTKHVESVIMMRNCGLKKN